MPLLGSALDQSLSAGLLGLFRILKENLCLCQLTGLFQFTVRLASETEARFTSVERIHHYIQVLGAVSSLTGNTGVHLR